jgi:hypothetical protein
VTWTFLVILYVAAYKDKHYMKKEWLCIMLKWSCLFNIKLTLVHDYITHTCRKKKVWFSEGFISGECIMYKWTMCKQLGSNWALSLIKIKEKQDIYISIEYVSEVFFFL